MKAGWTEGKRKERRVESKGEGEEGPGKTGRKESNKTE